MYDPEAVNKARERAGPAPHDVVDNPKAPVIFALWRR